MFQKCNSIDVRSQQYHTGKLLLCTCFAVTSHALQDNKHRQLEEEEEEKEEEKKRRRKKEVCNMLLLLFFSPKLATS